MRTRKTEKEEEVFDWWSAYQNPKDLSGVATQMIVFGLEEFHDAHVIRNLDRLEELIRNTDGDIRKMLPFKDEIAMFSFHDLTDTVRICTCYENLAKSLLIVNGFLVHTFDGERLRPLSNRQRKKPVSARYIGQCNITKAELSYKTVMFSDVLNGGYQKYIGFPDNVRSILRELNKSRNSLHLRTTMGIGLGMGLVEDLRTLKAGLAPWVELAKKG